MNYLQWNQKLYSYFFSNDQPVIYLSITKKILADISGLEEAMAFEDFKTAINSFPSQEDEKVEFPFLTNKIPGGYIKPTSFLQKAFNFKKAWIENYQYLPGPMRKSISSWSREKEPPYIGYLSALILMIDNSEVSDNAFWKTVRTHFNTIPGKYGKLLLPLFSDLKNHDNRFDYYSVYPSNIYVGTIYSQMLLTVNEIEQIKFFFVIKDISYDALLQMADSELFKLLVDDLDSAFANEMTIEALHTDDVQFKNFKIALPYILKKLIVRYEINKDTIDKALALTQKRKAAKKYELLLSFGTYNNIPSLPFKLVLKHGKNSSLLEEATDGIITIKNCNGKLTDEKSSCRLRMTAERDYSYPTAEGVLNEEIQRHYYIKHNLNLQDESNKEKSIIVFVPGSHYNINGYWIESPNKVIPINDNCFLLYHKNQAAKADTFLNNCTKRFEINNNLLPDNWNMYNFSGVSDIALLDGYAMQTTQKISLIGGCKADPFKNEFFNFSPPRIAVINFPENIQFTINPSNKNTNINVSFKNISNAIIERVDIEGTNNRNKFHLDIEIKITPENDEAPYASFLLKKSEIPNELNHLSVPAEIYYPKIDITRGNVIDNNFQQNLYCIQNSEQDQANEYRREDPRHVSIDSYLHQEDYVLFALSHKREFSFTQAVTIIESLCNETDNVVPYFLLDAIFTQGHIQEKGLNANFKDKKFEIVKPRLAKIPSQSNLYQLIGARSYDFMKNFISNAGEDDLRIMFLKEEFKLYPQKVLISIGTANINHKSCEFYRDSLNKYPGVGFLNSVQNYKNILPSIGLINELTEEQGYSFQKFEQEKLVFNSCQLDTVNHHDNQPMLFRQVRTYRNHNKPDLYFLKKDNSFYPVKSKQDAIYSFLAHTDDAYMGWIYFDKIQKLLAIPALVNFPENLRRSLSLLGCFSSIFKVQKKIIYNKPISFFPHIANGEMILSVDEESHTKIVLFKNVHDFIAEIIEKKLNKSLITNIDLSNLITINND